LDGEPAKPILEIPECYLMETHRPRINMSDGEGHDASGGDGGAAGGADGGVRAACGHGCGAAADDDGVGHDASDHGAADGDDGGCRAGKAGEAKARLADLGTLLGHCPAPVAEASTKRDLDAVAANESLPKRAKIKDAHGVPSVDLDESSASRGSQEETDDYTSETDSDRQSGAESDDNCSLAGVREEPHAPTGCRICKRCSVCAIHHQLNHQVGKTPEDATSCAMGCHYIHPKRRFCSTCIYKGNLHPL
jgi:hypothetical protein